MTEITLQANGLACSGQVFTIMTAEAARIIQVTKVVRMRIPIQFLFRENDLAMVRALREVTDAVFRVDANCAWNAERTVDCSRELKKRTVFASSPSTNAIGCSRA